MQAPTVIPFHALPADGKPFPRIGYRQHLVVKGEPVEYGATFYRDAQGRHIVGVWESEPGTLQFDSYPETEVCFVLEGRIELTCADGQRFCFGPQQGFMMQKGVTVTWEMPVKTKKFYVLLRA